MKNNALKNIFLYALLAVCALFLRGGCKDDAQKALETIYVPRYDTVARFSIPETPAELYQLISADPELRRYLQTTFQKIIYRRDTLILHDRSVDMSPMPVDTPVLIVFAEPEWSEDMRLFEGQLIGDSGRCTFKYLAGVQFDSLQFVAIEGQCKQITQQSILDLPSFLGTDWLGVLYGPAELRVGAKVSWSPQAKGWNYGLHSTWKGAYGAANYSPTAKSWLFEAGVLLPIGKKNR